MFSLVRKHWFIKCDTLNTVTELLVRSSPSHHADTPCGSSIVPVSRSPSTASSAAKVPFGWGSLPRGQALGMLREVRMPQIIGEQTMPFVRFIEAAEILTRAEYERKRKALLASARTTVMPAAVNQARALTLLADAPTMMGVATPADRRGRGRRCSRTYGFRKRELLWLHHGQTWAATGGASAGALWRSYTAVDGCGHSSTHDGSARSSKGVARGYLGAFGG
jgi:hypothetical protein